MIYKDAIDSLGDRISKDDYVYLQIVSPLLWGEQMNDLLELNSPDMEVNISGITNTTHRQVKAAEMKIEISAFESKISQDNIVIPTIIHPEISSARWSSDIRIYALINLGIVKSFSRIYSDMNKHVWKFEDVPGFTARVKYHKTQYDISTLGTEQVNMSRTRYAELPDVKIKNLSVEDVLNSLIFFSYNDREEISLVKRRVSNCRTWKYDGHDKRIERVPKLGHQFRYLYKPSHNEAAKDDYKQKVSTLLGVGLTDEEYYHQLQSTDSAVTRQSIRWFGSHSLYRVYIDLIYGGIHPSCTHYAHKRGVKYSKLVYKKRPMHIRVSRYVESVSPRIYRGLTKITYLGYVDNLKKQF